MENHKGNMEANECDSIFHNVGADGSAIIDVIGSNTHLVLKCFLLASGPFLY